MAAVHQDSALPLFGGRSGAPVGTPTSATSPATPALGSEDPLAETFTTLSSLARGRRLSAERSAHELDEHEGSRADFEAVCQQKGETP